MEEYFPNAGNGRTHQYAYVSSLMPHNPRDWIQNMVDDIGGAYISSVTELEIFYRWNPSRILFKSEDRIFQEFNATSIPRRTARWNIIHPFSVAVWLQLRYFISIKVKQQIEQFQEGVLSLSPCAMDLVGTQCTNPVKHEGRTAVAILATCEDDSSTPFDIVFNIVEKNCN